MNFNAEMFEFLTKVLFVEITLPAINKTTPTISLSQMVFIVAKLKIEETSHAASEKTFLNAKAQRHKVAIAAGKYREANIAEGKYHEVTIAKQLSRSKYRVAIIAQQLSILIFWSFIYNLYPTPHSMNSAFCR